MSPLSKLHSSTAVYTPNHGSSNYGPPVVQELQFPSCLVMSVNVSALQGLMGCVVLQQLEGRSLRIPAPNDYLVWGLVKAKPLCSTSIVAENQRGSTDGFNIQSCRSKVVLFSSLLCTCRSGFAFSQWTPKSKIPNNLGCTQQNARVQFT